MRGLYRYVRNPMYVGVLLVIAGWARLGLSRRGSVMVYGASVALAFHLFVVLVEEPILRGTFGAGYADLLASSHRWRPTLRK